MKTQTNFSCLAPPPPSSRVDDDDDDDGGVARSKLEGKGYRGGRLKRGSAQRAEECATIINTVAITVAWVRACFLPPLSPFLSFSLSRPSPSFLPPRIAPAVEETVRCLFNHGRMKPPPPPPPPSPGCFHLLLGCN